MTYGFRYFETRGLYSPDEPVIDARVYFGTNDNVPIGVLNPVHVTFPRGHYDDLDVEIDMPKQLEAPLEKGLEVGSLRVLMEDEYLLQTPLVTQRNIDEAGIFDRLFDAVYLFLAGLIE